MGVIYVVRVYMLNFYAEKPKVPFVQGYNKGIEHSKWITNRLSYLNLGWAITSALLVLSLV